MYIRLAKLVISKLVLYEYDISKIKAKKTSKPQTGQ